MDAVAPERCSDLDRAVARGIDSLFAHLSPDRPGAALAVLRGGEVVHLRCFGLANVEDKVAVTPHTVFRLGSATKHLCATLLLILENRGQLRLDDPVVRYIPELPRCAARVSLRHLLTMTSGFDDGVALTIFGATAHLALSREQHLQLLSRYQRLMYQPGEQMLYSNSNYALLSLLIERVTRYRLTEVFEREIFHPLGMASARLVERMAEAVPAKARGYVPGREGGMECGLMLYEASGDGGVDLSMLDFVRWFQNYRRDRLVGADYRKRMEETMRLPDGTATGYGLGINVNRHREWTRIGHAGGMPGYLADFNFYPEPDIGVLLLSNWMDAGLLDMSDRIADVVTGHTSPPAVDRSLPQGFYLCVEQGIAMEIQHTDACLISFMLGDRSPLAGSPQQGYTPTKRSVLYRIEVVPGCEELLVHFGDGVPARLRRWSEPTRMQDPEELVGAYTSPLLGETHHVVVAADGTLEIGLQSALRRLSWKTLRPRARDVFTAQVAGEPTESNLVVRFKRNGQGRVSALHYNTFRCRDVVFTRSY